MTRHTSPSRLRVAWGVALALLVTGPASAELTCQTDPDAPFDASEPHCYAEILVLGKFGVPLPCVELRTTSRAYTTDSQGVVAFFEPGLMNRRLWFRVRRDGYELPLGYDGLDLEVNEKADIFFSMEENGEDPGECNAVPFGSLLVGNNVPGPDQLFAIEVIDAETGRGVPLVHVRSPLREYVTDSNGLVAFHEPGVSGPTTFEVESHGYQLAPPNGGGSVELDVQPGASAQVLLDRNNIAERMYRMTGAGIYRDSALLGRDEDIPLARPLINGLVAGSDTALSTLYQGKIFWIWADTTRINRVSGLNNYKATGATSLLPGSGGLDPELGVDLQYFEDANGAARAMAPFPTGGVTWLGGLVAVPDETGEETLFTGYALHTNAGTESGLMRYNDDFQIFLKEYATPPEVQGLAAGTASPIDQPKRILHEDGEYVYPVVDLRRPATTAAFLDPNLSQDEYFTAFKQGTTELDRDVFGVLQWSWKPGTAIGGVTEPSERLRRGPVDPDTGETQGLWGTSVVWNPYLRRYVRISTDVPGNLIYGEADTPMGPWVYGRRIADVPTDLYFFYWPRQHPLLSKDGGRQIFFDGTYSGDLTSIYAGTPYYNYNLITYKLDLAGERVALPVPVYDLSAAAAPGHFATSAGIRRDMDDPQVAFFAPDRPTAETVPVARVGAFCGGASLAVGGPTGDALFHALPADHPSPPPDALPLYEYQHTGSGRRAYSVDPDLSLEDFLRDTDPLVLVWRNPLTVTLPVTDYVAPLVADAGLDQCLLDPGPGAGGSATLDAARSSALGGAVASYAWSWDDGMGGTATAAGASPQVSLPFDENTVTLTVTGSDGSVSTDTVRVSFAAVVPVAIEAQPDVLSLTAAAPEASPAVEASYSDGSAELLHPDMQGPFYTSSDPGVARVTSDGTVSARSAGAAAIHVRYGSFADTVSVQVLSAPPDVDQDFVYDAEDNCPGHANHFQQDRNGDGIGDACTASCDLNDDQQVDAADVALALRIANDELVPTPEQLLRGDVAPADGSPPDGVLDVADVTLLLRQSEGETLTVCNPDP